MKGALGCKPRRSLGWSGAIGSKDGWGCSMPQRYKIHVHRAGAPHLPRKLPHCSLPQFPSGIGTEKWGSQPAFAAQTHTVPLHLALDAMLGESGESHSLLLSRQGICGI